MAWGEKRGSRHDRPPRHMHPHGPAVWASRPTSEACICLPSSVGRPSNSQPAGVEGGSPALPCRPAHLVSPACAGAARRGWPQTGPPCPLTRSSAPPAGAGAGRAVRKGVAMPTVCLAVHATWQQYGSPAEHLNVKPQALVANAGKPRACRPASCCSAAGSAGLTRLGRPG